MERKRFNRREDDWTKGEPRLAFIRPEGRASNAADRDILRSGADRNIVLESLASVIKERKAMTPEQKANEIDEFREWEQADR